jgi:mRNA interferase HigB
VAGGSRNRVISRRAIREFLDAHPGLASSREALMTWYKTARTAPWTNFAKVRETYPGADAVGKLVVFNIAGNKIRLIALIKYETKPRRIYIRHVLTHREYDRGDWKE